MIKQLLTASEEKKLVLVEVFSALGTIQSETQLLPIRVLQLPRMYCHKYEIATKKIRVGVPSSNYPHPTIGLPYCSDRSFFLHKALLK